MDKKDEKLDIEQKYQELYFQAMQDKDYIEARVILGKLQEIEEKRKTENV
jgi:hypothetical protein